MTSDSSLLSVAAARTILDAEIYPGEPLPSTLDAALGRVLAETVEAPADHPSLDQSAIDGYALEADSPAGEYSLVGEWRPGSPPAEAAPAPGTACRVFTGTPLPAGCGLVKVEDAVAAADSVRTGLPSSSSWIRPRGGSVRAGATLLEAGAQLGPGEIAVLAAAGRAAPILFPTPRVLQISTGREIVPAAAPAEPWQIRDSNGPMLAALLRQAGCHRIEHRAVDEAVDSLATAVEAAAPFDFLLVSGGSSVGRYDNTAAALEAMGFEILFRRINARPGKPLVFARRGRQYAFGIPGNPVSHFAVFHVFIARALRCFAGLDADETLSARLVENVAASEDPRETFWPARLRLREGRLEAGPLPWVHSGDLVALRGIDGLIHLPAGAGADAGDAVEVLPCDLKSIAKQGGNLFA